MNYCESIFDDSFKQAFILDGIVYELSCFKEKLNWVSIKTVVLNEIKKFIDIGEYRNESNLEELKQIVLKHLKEKFKK